MENVKFHFTSDDQNRIVGLEISGLLVLDNAQVIQKELVGISNMLSNQVIITISDPEELDISFIQLLVAFIKRMDELNVNYQFVWNIDADQKSLLEHVGLSNELFMNN
jgi:anti-anti-sigma regulatory factor